MELSLLTLNLHTYQQHDGGTPWETMDAHEREVHILAEAITQQQIDVICFQEVGELKDAPMTHPYGMDPSNMAFRIAHRLQDWGHHYNMFQDWSHIGYGLWREGTAILSRYPMHYNYSTYVSHNRSKEQHLSRNVTMSCLDVPDFGFLHVANVHLNWWHHGFKEEFDTLCHIINRREHVGVRGGLLCGDFNAPAGGESYNYVVGNEEYVDQWVERYPDKFGEPTHRQDIDGWKHTPPQRIDYIFKKNGSPLTMKRMDLIFTGHFYPIVSDHYGYLAHYSLHVDQSVPV